MSTPGSSSLPTPEDRPRRILLLDCDAFFVQVARRMDPEGAGRARLLIVGGSSSGRGVVTSASYEARPYGVRSGMPTARALRLCPDATVVPVPRSACTERSRAIRRRLRTLAPVVQAASIDEFYLDLTGTERLFRGESLQASAERIRKDLLEHTGISVSVGGATARMVAKLAAGRAKPAGVHIVPPGGEGAFMEGFELGQIPGVGPKLAESLARRGLRTVPDLLPVSEAWLVRWFGETRGRWLWERARGIDPTPVVDGEERKSISSERTFREDVVDDPALERHLVQLALSVGRQLRKKGLRARTVTLKLRDHDFRTRQASRTVEGAVESDRAIREVATELLSELRARRRVPARLLGVGVSGLREGDAPRQLSLLEETEAAPPPETERDRKLSHLGDALRDRFGDEALRPGRVLEDDPEDRED